MSQPSEKFKQLKSRVRSCVQSCVDKTPSGMARMFNALQFKAQPASVIGVDVGSHSIKVVQMASVNGAMTITKSVMVPISGEPGTQEQVSASLKKALAGMAAQEARVVALVNCPQTCTRKIVTPHMPKTEMAQAVRWEAKNTLPFSIEDALIDYEILGEVSERGVKKDIVSVSVAPQETIHRLMDLFSKAEVELSAAIPASVSLQNLIAVSKEHQSSTVAVVEMGAMITELDIYANGRLAFSRKLPIAGDDITRSMTSTLMSGKGKIKLSQEEAEKIKKEYGIPGPEETGEIDGKILPSQMLSLIRPCVEQLTNEMERSFDFYREESHGDEVKKIILYGGGASLKGLAELLRSELEMDVEVGNPLNGIPVSSGGGDDREGSRVLFDLAVGAALNPAGGINLLPSEFKGKKERFRKSLSLQAVGTGVAVTMLLTFIGLNVQLESLQKKREALLLEKQVIVPQLEGMRSLIMADQTLKGQPFWEDVLREVSNTVEAGMYLTEFDMNNDAVNLKGVIIQDDQSSQSTLSNFMITLEEGIFRNVTLVTTRKQPGNEKVSEFEISAEVD